MEDLNMQIGELYKLLALHPPPHPLRSGFLNNLGHAVLTRYEQQGDAEDIDMSITLHKEALALRSPYLHKSISLNNLGRAVLARFQQRGDLKDLEESIALHREALALQVPPYPDRSFSLNNLANAVLVRFKQFGNPKDIGEAIAQFEEALKLRTPPHPNRINSVYNLASALLLRFEQQGDLKDINQSIALHREALGLLVPSDFRKSDFLTNLAAAILTRYETIGNNNDIDESMGLYRQALALRGPTHPHRSTSLNNLAHAFLIRFEQRGDPKDLDESIALHRQTLALQAATNLNRSDSFNNLGHALSTRFLQRGDSADIEESISLSRKALALQSPPHPHRSNSLSYLASVLLIRFEQQGNPKDIDECIASHREALILRAPPHPQHSLSLDNLAIAISARFDESGDPKDIDEAIVLLKEAQALRPFPHRHRSVSLSNLAQALLTRYKQQKDPQDIDKSIALLREAVALEGPSHPKQNMFLNNLGNAVSIRFELQGDPEDNNECIALYRKALALTPPPHPSRSVSLNNLAGPISVRFKLQEDRKDIDESVALYYEALALQSPPHPLRSTSLMNLGSALVLIHRQQPHEDILNDAISLFKQASTYSISSPLTRFNNSYTWAMIATQHSHISSLDAFGKAIDLLPQLAAFHLDLNSRQKILTQSQVTSLASDAAACAVDMKAYNLAVEFLEASRSVFWAQALRLRTPLWTVKPEFATRLDKLSRQLEVASFRDTSLGGYLSTGTQHKALSVEAEGVRCRELSEEWDKIINSVRMLPGFEDFLKPRNIVKLQQAAESGPVIILIASHSTSSALVVTASDDVHCVPLPEISLAKVKAYALIFRALSAAGSTLDLNKLVEKRALGEDSEDLSELKTRLLGTREGQVSADSDVVFRVLLEFLWKEIVKPVFDYLNLEKSSHPSRLWWCPTGHFAFLPIHASGIYETNYTDCVSDYVISSYTPTLSALLDPPLGRTPVFKITAVIEPNAPNCSRLPGTVAELAKIRDRVPGTWLTALRDTSGAIVVHHLQDSSMVHFACHGVQDLRNPLESGLMLSDGRLKVSNIMRGPESAGSERIRNSMSLAFLSACETAKGDDNTPDEAMHLAATVLFAGFRGVVATMWTIDDRDGPKVSDTFYEYLFKDCDAISNPPVLPDLTEAAEALHLAVEKLKKEPGITFQRWVPFVHYGL